MKQASRANGSVVLGLAFLLLISLFAAVGTGVQGQPPITMRAFFTVLGNATPDGTRYLFDPDEILIGVPQRDVSIHINITFINVDIITNANHNFTTIIDGVFYESPLIAPEETGYVEFWINTTGEFPYWCSVGLHRQLGMEGTFIVGVAPTVEGPEAVEQGLPLRAYWIGLIGILAMIAVIIVAYFAIKYESRHQTDHREHRRRGLP